MREFSDNRHEVTRRARETLQRLEDRERARKVEKWQRGPVDDPDREDALLRWKRLRQQSIEPPKPAPPPPKQRRNEMTETQVRDYVAQRLEEFASVMGEEVAAIENRIRSDFKAELDALRAEIGKGLHSMEALELPNWRSPHVEH